MFTIRYTMQTSDMGENTLPVTPSGVFRFTIDGDPVPKGSRTTGKRKDGTVYTREASKRYRPWAASAQQQLFAQADRAGRVRFGQVPLRLEIVAYCRRPKKPTYEWPTKGDTDKFLRAVGDQLQLAGVIADDRHIVETSARKLWTHGEPRIEGHLSIVAKAA